MREDKYKSFEELKAAEPQGHWRVVAVPRSTAAAIVAPHGGAIEPGTSEIARAIAADDLSCYAFEGLKAGGNRDLHITSSRFDEPGALKTVATAQRVVTVHGEGRDPQAVAYLGGRDEQLAAAVEGELSKAGFTVKKHADPEMQGVSQANICNRGTSGAGVQLELTRKLREELFASLTPAGRLHPTERLDMFAKAVRRAVQSA